MIGKTVTFENFNGEKVTETFYFHLSKAELAELETLDEGKSLSEMLEQMGENVDTSKVLSLLKKILSFAIGRKSEDGRRFVKNDEIRDDFFQSEAYSELLFSLLQNPDESLEFVRGMFPSDLRDNLDKFITEDGEASEEEIQKALKAYRESTR